MTRVKFNPDYFPSDESMDEYMTAQKLGHAVHAAMDETFTAISENLTGGIQPMSMKIRRD